MHKYSISWNGKSRSVFQRDVKLFLQSYWKYDIVLEELPILGCGTKLYGDIYNYSKKVLVEASGEQHYSRNDFFHGKGFKGQTAFAAQFQRDCLKQKWCENNGVKFVEIPYKEWYNCETLQEKLSVFEIQGVELC